MSLIPWKNKRNENGGHAMATADTFRQEVDRLFESFFHNPFGLMESSFTSPGEWGPSLDVSENESGVTVAELPGVKPEDLEVTVTPENTGRDGRKSTAPVLP